MQEFLSHIIEPPQEVKNFLDKINEWCKLSPIRRYIIIIFEISVESIIYLCQQLLIWEKMDLIFNEWKISIISKMSYCYASRVKLHSEYLKILNKSFQRRTEDFQYLNLKEMLLRSSCPFLGHIILFLNSYAWVTRFQ